MTSIFQRILTAVAGKESAPVSRPLNQLGPYQDKELLLRQQALSAILLQTQREKNAQQAAITHQAIQAVLKPSDPELINGLVSHVVSQQTAMALEAYSTARDLHTESQGTLSGIISQALQSIQRGDLTDDREIQTVTKTESRGLFGRRSQTQHSLERVRQKFPPGMDITAASAPVTLEIKGGTSVFAEARAYTPPDSNGNTGQSRASVGPGGAYAEGSAAKVDASIVHTPTLKIDVGSARFSVRRDK